MIKDKLLGVVNDGDRVSKSDKCYYMWRVWNHNSLISNKMGVFEEFPFMKNCGTTRERGRNWTWGRQSLLLFVRCFLVLSLNSALGVIGNASIY